MLELEKSFFPHRSQLQYTRPSDFVVDWVPDVKIYWGVTLALDKDSGTLAASWGLSAFSWSLPGKVCWWGNTQKWSWEVKESSCTALYSVCDGARAKHGGGGRQYPIQLKTGTLTQGNREEQSYLSSSSHTSAQGHNCWTWTGMAISLNNTEVLSSFLPQIKLCQDDSFWADYVPHSCFLCEQRQQLVLMLICIPVKVDGTDLWELHCSPAVRPRGLGLVTCDTVKLSMANTILNTSCI